MTGHEGAEQPAWRHLAEKGSREKPRRRCRGAGTRVVSWGGAEDVAFCVLKRRLGGRLGSWWGRD